MKKLSSFLKQLQLFLLHLLFLLTPFVFTWVNNELFEFNKMIVIYGFAFTLISLWFGRMLLEKQLIWRKHPLNKLVLIFLGGQILSFIFSMHLPSSWWGYHSRLNGGLLSSLVFVGLYFAIFNTVSKKQAKQLLLTNVIALGLVSLYAIPEHFGASPSCVLISNQWNVACWKQDVQARIFASFGQPNWLAAYLVTLSPLAWWLTFKSKTKSHKIIFGGISFLATLALWYTKSKSGLLAFGIAGLVFALGWAQLKWKLNLLKSKKTKLIGVLISALAIIALGSKYFSSSIPSSESFDLSKGSSSADIRKIVWQGAWKVWQRYPLLGSGPATFAYSYYQDRPLTHNLVSEWDFIYNKAHNEILNYLAETGLVGLGSYLVFAGGNLWLLLKTKKGEINAKKTTQQSILNFALVSGLIGMHVSNFFGFSTAMTNLLLFVLPSLGIVIEGEFLESKRNTNINQYLQKALFGSIFIIWFFCVSFLVKTWLADYYNAQGTVLISSSQYTDGLEHQQKAIELNPKSGEFYESLANTYAKLALIYHYDEQPEISQSLYQATLANSDYALALNPHHLNFYKTKVRVLLLLAEFDEDNLTTAEKTLLYALEISPTDAKLWYNLGITLAEQEKTEEAIKILEETVKIKPNYVKAREKLGDYYLEIDEIEKARIQYQFILEKLSPNNEEIMKKLYENPKAF